MYRKGKNKKRKKKLGTLDDSSQNDGRYKGGLPRSSTFSFCHDFAVVERAEGAKHVSQIVVRHLQDKLTMSAVY